MNAALSLRGQCNAVHLRYFGVILEAIILKRSARLAMNFGSTKVNFSLKKGCTREQLRLQNCPRVSKQNFLDFIL